MNTWLNFKAQIFKLSIKNKEKLLSCNLQITVVTIALIFQVFTNVNYLARIIYWLSNNETKPTLQN